MERAATTRKIVMLGAATELGRETVQQLTQRGHQVMAIVQRSQQAEPLQALGAAPLQMDALLTEALTRAFAQFAPDVVLNLVPQRANTLLHDGHKWHNFADPLRATSTALAEAARATGVPRVIHTSYTFLCDATGNGISVPGGDPVLRAALDAEHNLFSITEPVSASPVTIARLGYLYGPQSHDLRLYVRAFGLHRPYFAGPPTHRANWLHFSDAARALVLLSEAATAPRERAYAIVADASSFTDFMDHFAHLLGVKHPLHIPLWASGLARAIITKEQMVLLRQARTTSAQPFSDEFGWTPEFADYHEGLAATLRAWG